MTGGETAALQRLKHYLWDTDALAVYFNTRNGMLGPDYSTKFSAWLAQVRLIGSTCAAAHSCASGNAPQHVRTQLARSLHGRQAGCSCGRYASAARQCSGDLYAAGLLESTRDRGGDLQV